MKDRLFVRGYQRRNQTFTIAPIALAHLVHHARRLKEFSLGHMFLATPVGAHFNGSIEKNFQAGVRRLALCALFFA